MDKSRRILSKHYTLIFMLKATEFRVAERLRQQMIRNFSTHHNPSISPLAFSATLDYSVQR